MTFTDDVVRRDASRLGLTGTIAELRVKLAERSEREYEDYVEGWEIRTGRPWTEMTKQEAEQLVAKHPSLVHSPGIISKLMGAK